MCWAGRTPPMPMDIMGVPEMFRHWLQGERITVGFLSAAEVDKFGNINTTVIGDYDAPKVRLPGGGGAPEIVTSSQEVYIALKQSLRSMVPKIQFFTSFGHGAGGGHRAHIGVHTKGPALRITDLAIWRADPITKEFIVYSIYKGVPASTFRPLVAGR